CVEGSSEPISTVLGIEDHIGFVTVGEVRITGTLSGSSSTSLGTPPGYSLTLPWYRARASPTSLRHSARAPLDLAPALRPATPRSYPVPCLAFLPTSPRLLPDLARLPLDLTRHPPGFFPTSLGTSSGFPRPCPAPARLLPDLVWYLVSASLDVTPALARLLPDLAPASPDLARAPSRPRSDTSPGFLRPRSGIPPGHLLDPA
ncbi:hypothetical protein Dimus_020139, partial [Dionaea muscipula]